jgi:hypothetical protein
MKKKMRKSRSVRIGLLGGIAASCVAFGGCTRSQQPADSWDQVCVDNNSTVANSQQCEDEQKARMNNPGYVPMHHWYYLHSGLGVPGYYPVGSRVSGGTLSPPAASQTGGSGSHRSTVIRSGFGATGAGHSASS